MKNNKKRIIIIAVAVALVIAASVGTIWATNRTEQLREEENFTTKVTEVAKPEETSEAVTEPTTVKVTEEATEAEATEIVTESQSAQEVDEPTTKSPTRTTEDTTKATERKTEPTTAGSSGNKPEVTEKKQEKEPATEYETQTITPTKKEPVTEGFVSKITYAEAQRVQKAANDYMASIGLKVDSNLTPENSCWGLNSYLCDNPEYGWDEYNFEREVRYCKDAIYCEAFDTVSGDNNTEPIYKSGYAYLEKGDSIQGGYNIIFCFRYT